MYSIPQYGAMMADEVRMSAYEAALRHHVVPGAVVMDLGAGTGIFALLACRLGARRVFAVEPAPAIEVARELARANGYGDRIVCIDRPVEEIGAGDVPEPVDLLVSDMRGVLPLCGGQLRAVADARRRFLRPGGACIPLRDTLFAAPVEASGMVERHLTSWTQNPWALEMGPAAALAVNSLWPTGEARVRLLAPPRRVATLHYAAQDDVRPRAELAFTLRRPGQVHGLLLWFDAELAPGIRFSNRPRRGAASPRVYGRALLPFAQRPALGPSGEVCVALRADPAADDWIWSWRTELRERGATIARFEQSSFRGRLLPRRALRERAEPVRGIAGNAPAPGVARTAP